MRLKKWVKTCLAIICIASIIVMISDTDNLMLFITSHVIAGIVFMISSNLLLERKN